jgi:Thioredoxin
MNQFKITPEFWAKTQSLDEYASTMTQYQNETRQRLENVRLSREQRQLFSGLDVVRYVLATTEDWCGDAVFNVPIVVRIVETLPRAQLRVIPRPGDTSWKEYLFAQALIHIPVITFLDDNFNELAVWMERPKIAAHYMEEWRNARPDFLAVRNSTDLDPAVRKARLAPYYAQLIQDMYGWYDGEPNLQQATVREIADLLTHAVWQAGSTGRP